MAELPPEVVERLSTQGRVRLVVGEGAEHAAEVHIAPLHKQLFLLVAPGGASEQRFLEDPRAAIVAEDREAGWYLRAAGRAVPGRRLPAEARRSELMYWVPEGVLPSALVAVRFHPETVEYVQGKGSTRSRAAGAIPGAAPPSRVQQWVMLCTDRVVVLYGILAAVVWFGLLFLVEEPERRTGILYGVVVFAGASLLAGVQLADQAARFTRWREGLETDADAKLVLEGWVGPRRIRRLSLGMIGLGFGLAGLLSVGAGWRIGVLAVGASTAPLLGAFHLVRHLLRRNDAARESA